MSISKFRPWSECSSTGVPNRQTKFSINVLVTAWLFYFGIAMASVHLVTVSVITMMEQFPLFVRGKCPNMSIVMLSIGSPGQYKLKGQLLSWKNFMTSALFCSGKISCIFSLFPFSASHFLHSIPLRKYNLSQWLHKVISCDVSLETLSHVGLFFPVSSAAIMHPMFASDSCCHISVGPHPDSRNLVFFSFSVCSFCSLLVIALISVFCWTFPHDWCPTGVSDVSFSI